MRIDSLSVKNFRGFAQREFLLHPHFNLIVGTNGTGKTSMLDALAIAIGSWFLGIRGAESRHIRTDEVRLVAFPNEETGWKNVHWESMFPCEIRAYGEVQEKPLEWSRKLNSPNGRTTYVEASDIKELAIAADADVRKGKKILLPLISYYGTGRLWKEPRDVFRIIDPLQVTNKEDLSRFAGYWNSVDPRLSVNELTRWIARQSWIAYSQREIPSIFTSVKNAMVGCVEGATDLSFDPGLGEVVVTMRDGRYPFSNLSDGQRCMLAMVGDIAQKAALLNPHLGDETLQETAGVVLIDELDLHLHPRWQRRIIEDLRRTFPKIQFVCTTHSPFLIQSLRTGEELILLDGQPTAELANMSVEDIAQGIMGVPNPQVSLRYEEMRGAARHYLELLETSSKTPEEKLADFKEQLAKTVAPYASNPAFQAFLEMKRLAKMGE